MWCRNKSRKYENLSIWAPHKKLKINALHSTVRCHCCPFLAPRAPAWRRQRCVPSCDTPAVAAGDRRDRGRGDVLVSVGFSARFAPIVSQIPNSECCHCGTYKTFKYSHFQELESLSPRWCDQHLINYFHKFTLTHDVTFNHIQSICTRGNFLKQI